MGDGQRQKVSKMKTIERTTYGAPQYVMSQDRTNLYPMYLENLHSTIVEKDGIFYGINLMMETDKEAVLLGTFDTVEEVIREINELYNTNLEIYYISRYPEEIIMQ